MWRCASDKVLEYVLKSIPMPVAGFQSPDTSRAMYFITGRPQGGLQRHIPMAQRPAEDDSIMIHLPAKVQSLWLLKIDFGVIINAH